jgi:hypothetical protein
MSPGLHPIEPSTTMTKSEITIAIEGLTSDVANKQNRLASLQAEVDSLAAGLAEMPTTYADLATAAGALPDGHPDKIKWADRLAEFQAMQATVNGGISPTA